jgi:uncharacterized repeat protein (TIGR02543 family)
LTGCDNGSSPGSGSDPELSGKITISPSAGVKTGKELTVSYSGSEKVDFQWNRDGKAINHAYGKLHTPAHTGSYTVTASAKGYKSKTSAAVSVTGADIPEYTVTFDSNGGTAVEDELVTQGGHVNKPDDPTKTGYDCIFDGWYKAGLTDEWDFDNNVVTSSITLYAKWKPYEIGDAGPGGGKIFYRIEAGFDLYTGSITSDNTSVRVHYLEAAPSNALGGPSGAQNTTMRWDGLTYTIFPNNGTGIGMGRKNTLIIYSNSPIYYHAFKMPV